MRATTPTKPESSSRAALTPAQAEKLRRLKSWKPDLEKLLLDIAGRGTLEVARRGQHFRARIFRHASWEGGPIIRNPAADLAGIYPSAEPGLPRWSS